MPRSADTADLRLCLTDPLHPQPGQPETKPGIQSRAGGSSAGPQALPGPEQDPFPDGKIPGRTGLPPGLDSSQSARLQRPGARTASPRLSLTADQRPKTRTQGTKQDPSGRKGGSSGGPQGQPDLEQDLSADMRMTGRANLTPGPDPGRKTHLQRPGARTASPRLSLTADQRPKTRTQGTKQDPSGRKGGSSGGPQGQPDLEQDLSADMRMTGRADPPPDPNPGRKTDLQQQKANTAGLLPLRRPALLR